MHTSIRFSPTKEQDLIEFFESKGLKQGIKFLYEFYQERKDRDWVQEIVCELKKEMAFSTPQTTVVKKKITTLPPSEPDNDEMDFLGGIIK
jgi:hypothetical protein